MTFSSDPNTAPQTSDPAAQVIDQGQVQAPISQQAGAEPAAQAPEVPPVIDLGAIGQQDPANIAAPPATEPSTQDPAPAAPPIDRDAVLREVTGGGLQSQSDWETFQSRLRQAEDRAASMEAIKAQMDAINPLASKVNALLAEGKSLSDVKLFIEAQTIDTASMSDLDAVRAKLKMDFPTLTADQVESYLVEQGLVSDSDVPSTSMLVKQQQMGREAKSFLEAQKVLLGDTPSLQQRQQAVQAAEANFQQWVQNPPAISNQNITEGDYSVSLQLSPEAKEFGKQAALAWAKSNNPELNQANKEQFNEVAQKMALLHDFDKVVRFLVSDATAKAMAKAAKAVSGPPPSQVPAGQAPGEKAPYEPVRFSGR